MQQKRERQLLHLLLFFCILHLTLVSDRDDVLTLDGVTGDILFPCPIRRAAFDTIIKVADFSHIMPFLWELNCGGSKETMDCEIFVDVVFCVAVCRFTQSTSIESIRLSILFAHMHHTKRFTVRSMFLLFVAFASEISGMEALVTLPHKFHRGFPGEWQLQIFQLWHSFRQ